MSKNTRLYPAWLTKNQILLLRNAEKGMIPKEAKKKLDQIIEGSSHPTKINLIDDAWDGRENKIKKFIFTDHPVNRFFNAFQEVYGGLFGLMLASRFLNYASFSKPEAERKIKDEMKVFEHMRKGD